MAVLMDELTAARIEPLLLPLPADERALTGREPGPHESGRHRHDGGSCPEVRAERANARTPVPRGNRDVVRVVAAEGAAA